MGLLSEAERHEFVAGHPEWMIVADSLEREYTFANFGAAIGFVVQVGMLAEKANHHPDLDIRWRTVRVALTSHDAGGLTDRDVSLAATIEMLAPPV